MFSKMLGKAQVAVAAGIVSLAVSGIALASPELAQKSGCMGCHDVSVKKMGPAFKEVASKYKGKSDAQEKLVDKVKNGKGHPKVSASEGDIATLVKWVLSQ